MDAIRYKNASTEELSTFKATQKRTGKILTQLSSKVKAKIFFLSMKKFHSTTTNETMKCLQKEIGRAREEIKTTVTRYHMLCHESSPFKFLSRRGSPVK